MTEKYRPLQEKYINPYLNAFSNDHSHIYNDQNLGPVFMPFDYSDSSGTAEITQSPLFFDPEFIAVNTLAKNYSVGNKSVGFAGRTYSGDDGNQYLDPTDYRMYTQSSYANIARNIYPVATTMFFSFDYTTTLEIPT
ncbi:MAG: hypothetical protein K2M43_01735 [Mycoplasmoidaceae bacterium]|nr:hypothetical protein [Mycoplasmoidaceae bacterium]